MREINYDIRRIGLFYEYLKCNENEICNNSAMMSAFMTCWVS